MSDVEEPQQSSDSSDAADSDGDFPDDPASQPSDPVDSIEPADSDPSPPLASSSASEDLSAGFTSPFLLSRDAITAKGIRDHEVAVYQAKFYQDSFAISTWLEHFRDIQTSVPSRFLLRPPDDSGPADPPTPPPPRPVTFDTIMVDVSFDEAKELLKLYRVERLGVEDEARPDEEILENLVRRMDEAMGIAIHVEEEEEGEGGEEEAEEAEAEASPPEKRFFFLKLDTRSPKDAPVDMADDVEVQKIVRSAFDNWVEEMYQQEEEEEKMDDAAAAGAGSGFERNFLTLMKKYPEEVHIRFKRAMANCMRIGSGKWALKLLAHSHRVYEDLAKGTRFGRDHFKFRIILREWVQHVVDNPQYEFRTFVCKRNMHAISQYFCDNYFPELVERKKEIEDEITDFYSRIRDSIPHESFVLDVFVGSREVGPMVIELNPFHVGAGGCLFSWNHDRDVFLNGPLEFRIRTQSAIPEEDEDGWKILVNRALTRKWETFMLETYGGAAAPKKKCLIQ